MNLKKGDKKLIGAWAFYDWANSVYSLVIGTAIFPIYYNSITGGNEASWFHFWGAILTTQHFTATPCLFRFLRSLCCLPSCLVLRILWGIKSVLCSFSVFWVRGLFRLCFFLKASIHFGLVLSLWFWRALAFGVVWCFTMLTSRKLPTQKITTK